MSINVQIYDIARIAVTAQSLPLAPSGLRVHCQILELHSRDGTNLGQIMLFLESPAAALPIGSRGMLDAAAAEIKEVEEWPF